MTTGDDQAAWEKRQAWLDSVVALREGRVLTERDQEILVEHYDRIQRDLGAAVADLAPEYKRRISDDGKQAADEWLARESRELGVQRGRELRRTIDSLGIDPGS